MRTHVALVVEDPSGLADDRVMKHYMVDYEVDSSVEHQLVVRGQDEGWAEDRFGAAVSWFFSHAEDDSISLAWHAHPIGFGWRDVLEGWATDYFRLFGITDRVGPAEALPELTVTVSGSDELFPYEVSGNHVVTPFRGKGGGEQ